MESVYSTIQISTAAVSDNYNTTKAAICNMAEAPEIVDFPARNGPEKAYIIYSGPTPSAGKDSVGSQHGSFIVSWDNPHIPRIICAVAHPGSVSQAQARTTWLLPGQWRSFWEKSENTIFRRWRLYATVGTLRKYSRRPIVPINTRTFGPTSSMNSCQPFNEGGTLPPLK